jgi:hypothetical protein
VTTGAWVALAVVLVALYVTWTAGRLDRMHARVDASWAALDAQLVRRTVAARALLLHLPPGPEASLLDERAAAALAAGEAERDLVENALTRAVRAVVPLLHEDSGAEQALAELEAAAAKVGLSRSFHNNAVAGARALRRRRLPRLLRLAGRRAMPAFFDIDDTALHRPAGAAPS